MAFPVNQQGVLFGEGAPPKKKRGKSAVLPYKEVNHNAVLAEAVSRLVPIDPSTATQTVIVETINDICGVLSLLPAPSTTSYDTSIRSLMAALDELEQAVAYLEVTKMGPVGPRGEKGLKGERGEVPDLSAHPSFVELVEQVKDLADRVEELTEAVEDLEQ